jgi:NAD(P)H-dependent FMN reductase
MSVPSTTHVVGICGSLRDGSYTRKSLRIALESAETEGASVDMLDTREMELPVFDADHGDQGDADELRERVRAADAILLGTPVYHGSYSAPLKNALDYCGFDEFENTTVGLLCVAGGGFPVTSLDHLRSVCRALDAWVIPHQVAIPGAHNKFEGDTLEDESIEERIRTLGAEAVEYAHIHEDPPSIESTENVGADD